jgi:hypothetical protein
MWALNPGIVVMTAFISLFLTSVVAAQPTQVKRQTPFYFTRIALPTRSDCRIELKVDDISPGAYNCEFDDHISARTQVRILKTIRSGSWIKLEISTKADRPNIEDSTFSIYLDNSSPQTFRYVFDRVFSHDEEYPRDEEYPEEYKEDSPCNGKTKCGVLFSVGIPSQIIRKGEREYWHYYVTHPSSLSRDAWGFDAATVEFFKNRVVEISGII